MDVIITFTTTTEVPTNKLLVPKLSISIGNNLNYSCVKPKIQYI